MGIWIAVMHPGGVVRRSGSSLGLGFNRLVRPITAATVVLVCVTIVDLNWPLARAQLSSLAAGFRSWGRGLLYAVTVCLAYVQFLALLGTLVPPDAVMRVAQQQKAVQNTKAKLHGGVDSGGT